jgi:uncharacterized protein (TIGR02145 family)
MKFPTYILLLGSLAIFSVSCTKDEEKPTEPVTDVEGNIYKTVRIGTQVWMAENLKTTKYNDETNIPLVTDSVAWRNLRTPAYCIYNKNDTSYKRTYGLLYNGFATDSGKVCPTGWHIPAKEDWQKLREFLADSVSEGGRLKESGTEHWKSPNQGATNISGFAALPGGMRYFEGSFTAILYYTCFWSSTDIDQADKWFLSLYYDDAKINISHVSKKHGFSVRCIKD